MEIRESKQFNKCLLNILIFLMIFTGSANTIFIKIFQKYNWKKRKEKIYENHQWLIIHGMFFGEFISIFYYAYKVIKGKNQLRQNQGDTPE